ncbi:epidermal retinol dehydrogenase 2 isoform X2 [Eurytemora carolleeae]|uniref:epidermal retinol dehydrogenase 2 isoform X2 n=1 Tax=Eurytemora carolleeae TaxID=1294199 RepID=UPI000C769CD0|nr:epidermal retinol dehydrogenase 2 isoform X2 [Eurytemora carolleeae]|eukprot:XP_023339978.1 epidermal retinol dehydrogenase 2-like isoform X2 [Eurytemora affinis]
MSGVCRPNPLPPAQDGRRMESEHIPGVEKKSKPGKEYLLYQEGGGANSVLRLSVIIYRHVILTFDIMVFFLKAVGEYFRLTYRYFVPRALRPVRGEVALVTGAGHGIGREVALKLGRLGAIIICVDINEESNRQAAKQIKAEGGVAWDFQCDVSNKEEVGELGRRVREDVGDVNILINNAGVMITKQFMEQSDLEIEKTVNVNLMGQLWCLREFLPAMLKLNRGSIVFMCGLPGHAGAPNMVPYSASKFAIRGMMEALYIELRQSYPGNKLHLMLVSPFIVETGMVKSHRIRFPNFMGVVDVPTAADTICNSLRRRAAIVFIPEIFYYVSSLVRILPAKVQLLLTDFFDTGIDSHE